MSEHAYLTPEQRERIIWLADDPRGIEPPCECERVDVDQVDATGCPLHCGSYEKRVREFERELSLRGPVAIEMLDSDLDSLHAELRRTQDERDHFQAAWQENVRIKHEQTAKIDALRAERDRMRTAMESLRSYVAAEGRPDGDKLLIGLTNGTTWGPTGDPEYDLYEFAENVEKWLRDKCDRALNPQPAQQGDEETK